MFTLFILIASLLLARSSSAMKYSGPTPQWSLDGPAPGTNLTMCNVTLFHWTVPQTNKTQNFWVQYLGNQPTDSVLARNRTASSYTWLGSLPVNKTFGTFPFQPKAFNVTPGIFQFVMGDLMYDAMQAGNQGYNLTAGDNCSQGQGK
ncbi:hypothetical protein T439DRAFT_356981 [Meredithblackwellia eburnea MCA 4105]